MYIFILDTLVKSFVPFFDFICVPRAEEDGNEMGGGGGVWGGWSFKKFAQWFLTHKLFCLIEALALKQ